MSTIVILFILILCVACFKQSQTEDDEEVVPGRQGRRADPDSSDEEPEPVFTLKEEDYDRFFPMVDIESHKEQKTGISDEICSICIDKILNGEKVRRIKFCKHYFHNKCLHDWLKVNETCPNCKLECNTPNLVKLEKKAKSEKKKRPLQILKDMDLKSSENSVKNSNRGGRSNLPRRMNEISSESVTLGRIQPITVNVQSNPVERERVGEQRGFDEEVALNTRTRRRNLRRESRNRGNRTGSRRAREQNRSARNARNERNDIRMNSGLRESTVALNQARRRDGPGDALDEFVGR
jgi:hypothetical protein